LFSDVMLGGKLNHAACYIPLFWLNIVFWFLSFDVICY